MHRWRVAIGLASLLGLTAVPPASADSIVFTFDHTTANPLADGANSTAIQTYMRNVIFAEWGIVNGVTVWGAKAEMNNSYTGDGHVVGPTSGSTVTPLTLGNSNHASSQGTTLGTAHDARNDGYIYNSNSVMFWMQFTFPISQISFDYAIFPNGSCGNPKDAGSPSNPGAGGGSCSVWPDFTLKAGELGSMQTYLWSVSQDPAEAGYVGYTHSPVSGAVNKEKAPQLLAVSGLITFASPVTRLEFYDWPERIGVDNLVLYRVPEPSAMALLGIGAACALVRRRAARRLPRERTSRA